MSDDVSLASTTDTQEQMNEALGITPPADAPAPDPVPAAPEAPPAQDASAPQKPKGSKKAESRIANLTRERYEMQARAEQAERELAALREGKTPGPVPPAPVAPAPVVDRYAEAGPEPKEDDFDGDFSKYMAAVRAWDRAVAKIDAKVEAEASARATIEAERKAQWEAQQREIANQQALAYNQRLDRAKDVLPDFDAVMKAGENLPYIPSIAQWCQAEANGIAIGYYLIQHPDVFDRIARLPAPMAWTELGRLDAKYEAGLVEDLPKIDWTARPSGQRRVAAPVVAQVPVVESPATPAVPAEPAAVPTFPPAGRPSVVGASRAPAPPPRVGGGGAATQVDPDKMSHQEYKKWRESQGATH